MKKLNKIHYCLYKFDKGFEIKGYTKSYGIFNIQDYELFYNKQFIININLKRFSDFHTSEKQLIKTAFHRLKEMNEKNKII